MCYVKCDCAYRCVVLFMLIVLARGCSELCQLFFFQAEDGIRDLVRSRGLGDVYKRQVVEVKRLNQANKPDRMACDPKQPMSSAVVVVSSR